MDLVVQTSLLPDIWYDLRRSVTYALIVFDNPKFSRGDTLMLLQNADECFAAIMIRGNENRDNFGSGTISQRSLFLTLQAEIHNRIRDLSEIDFESDESL